MNNLALLAESKIRTTSSPMGGIRQGKEKASSVNEEGSIAKLAQHMYYQLLDEYNELEKKAKKKQTSKIKIQLQIS